MSAADLVTLGRALQMRNTNHLVRTFASAGQVELTRWRRVFAVDTLSAV